MLIVDAVEAVRKELQDAALHSPRYGLLRAGQLQVRLEEAESSRQHELQPLLALPLKLLLLVFCKGLYWDGPIRPEGKPEVACICEVKMHSGKGKTVQVMSML